MNKDINYTGYTAVPSDYEAPDGQLSSALNVINEDGGLHVILPPALYLPTAPLQPRMAYVHHTASYTHYIIVPTKADTDINSRPLVCYILQDGTTRYFEDNPSADDLQRIATIGNCLLLIYSDSVRYYIWGTDDTDDTPSADDAQALDHATGYYKPLGTHLPDVQLQFGLQGRVKFSAQEVAWCDGGNDDSQYWIDKTDVYKAWPSLTTRVNITNSVMGTVNKFIADNATNKGRFIFPFFIRYALRLFDGSLVMQSAPIYMCCSSGECPNVIALNFRKNGDGDKYKAVDYRVAGIIHTLVARTISRDTTLASLAQWKDIIRSVDIFISKPIYTFDQSGNCRRFLKTAPTIQSVHLDADYYIDQHNYWNRSFLVRPNGQLNKADDNDASLARYTLYNHADRYFNELILRQFSDDDRTIIDDDDVETDDESIDSKKYVYGVITDNDDFKEHFIRRVQLPPLDEPDAAANDNCNYYLLYSYDIDSLPEETFSAVDIKDDYLQSLTSRETLPDDYDSHDSLVPAFTHQFNARLNIANIVRHHFQGFPLASQLNIADDLSYPSSLYSVVNWSGLTKAKILGVGTSTSAADSYSGNYSADSDSSWCQQNTLPESISALFSYTIYYHIHIDGRDIVVASPRSDGGISTSPRFLYYPNANCYKAVIVRSDGKYVTLRLKTHDFLTGAYWYGTISADEWASTGDLSALPSASTDTISPAPNKVYTSEVNNPFYFPLANINTVPADRILGISTAAKALSQGQFGQFPLYAFTNEGIWALEVSSTGTYSAKQPIARDVCSNPESITQIDSSVLFATSRGILELSGSETTCISDIIRSVNPTDIPQLPLLDSIHTLLGHNDQCLSYAPFNSYINDCRLSYDYLNQRLFIFNPAYDYSYVFSMKSHTWGLINRRLYAPLNSYPQPLVLDDNRNILDLSGSDNTEASGLIITRPIKLDLPDTLKTVNNVIQRGYFHRGQVQSVLYGSRDLYHWHLIWSSNDHYLRGFSGTPYKYFRLALLLRDFAPADVLVGSSWQFTPRLLNQPR
jgi:hypothetical protein